MPCMGQQLLLPHATLAQTVAMQKPERVVGSLTSYLYRVWNMTINLDRAAVSVAIHFVQKPERKFVPATSVRKSIVLGETGPIKIEGHASKYQG